ncbi:MAG: MarR family transcriptional regulator [Rubellimicrobium sp.]|nr:MarR family transcriptional regulator [Rubellimicrobium sp.]
MAERQTAPGTGAFSDEELRRSIEALFFAYRAFTADPDRILEVRGLGRAHHRAIHFINRQPGMTVSTLLFTLGITKQALNRVLRRLIAEGLVRSDIGRGDRRNRHLFLTPAGAALEHELSDAQRARVGGAFRAAGTDAVAGFRAVLEAMMDDDGRRSYAALGDARRPG